MTHSNSSARGGAIINVAALRGMLDDACREDFDKAFERHAQDLVLLLRGSAAEEDPRPLLAAARAQAGAMERLIESWWVSAHLASSSTWQQDSEATDVEVRSGVDEAIGADELLQLLQR